jgi:sugar/nucleoside kinase (ribokinase family)
VYARRVGAESAYLGVLATDEPARHLRAALGELGVSTERCVEREGVTGWCDVTVVDGDRVFGDWDGGVVLDQPFVPNDDDFRYLAGFDLVHVGAYAALEPSLPQLREHARLVSFDLSDEPEQRDPEYLDSVVPHVDLAVLSVADLSWPEAEDLARDVHRRGAPLVLLTRGLDGSAVFDGAAFHRAPAVAVEATDTMGAGDAFITSFTLSLLDGGWTRGNVLPADVFDGALHRAARFAAHQCSLEGAFGYAKEILQ